MNATILDGAVLEDEVMVAAGALVPPGKRLPGRTLWAGSPAKQVRELSEDQLRFLRYSAGHYVTVKDEHLAAASGPGSAV